MKKCKSGGSVYEAEMLGMKPSTKRPSINYEKDMVGMKPKKMAMGGVGKIRHSQSTASGAPKGPKKAGKK